MLTVCFIGSVYEQFRILNILITSNILIIMNILITFE